MSIKLSSGDRKKINQLVRKEIESIKKNILEDISGSIQKQLVDEEDEIRQTSIIACCFKKELNAPVQFVRTAPLFAFKQPNFDVMLFGNGTLVLISIKSSLIAKPISEINEFKEYVTKTEGNFSFQDFNKQTINVFDYFSRIVNDTITSQEYALAVEKERVTQLQNKKEEINYNFNLWKLHQLGAKCTIIYERIRLNDAEAPRQHNTHLYDYLRRLEGNAIPFISNIINFLPSSSRYWKAMAISTVLFYRAQEGFDFDFWENCFKINVNNWDEEEKKLFYRNYIDYGLRAGFIRQIGRNTDFFKKKFKVRSKGRDVGIIKSKILTKIIKFESNLEIKKKIEEITKEKREEYLKNLETQKNKENSQT